MIQKFRTRASNLGVWDELSFRLEQGFGIWGLRLRPFYIGIIFPYSLLITRKLLRLKFDVALETVPRRV